MAERERRTRRTRRTKPQVEEVQEVELEEDELEEDEEVEETKPSPKKRTRSKKADPDPEPEDDDYDDDDLEEDEEDEAPEPPKKRGRRVVKKADPEPEEDDDEEEPDEAVGDYNFVSELIDLLQPNKVYTMSLAADGESINIAVSDGVLTAGKPQGRGLRGKAFDDEVLSDDYKEWHKEWSQMSVAKKQAVAKKAKAEWDEHDNEPTNMMRMATATWKALGIEKYKPQYATQASRRALR